MTTNYRLSLLSPVGDALDDLDRLSGWRARLVLPPEAADAEALVSALPWVVDGAPRPGTIVRLFEVREGLLLVTGGALSDEEGAYLFEIQERLKDIATHVLIVPPAQASPSLVDRMYASHAAPAVPTDKLPNPRGWAGLGSVFLMFLGAMAYGARNADTVSFEARALLGAALALAMLCGLMWARSDRRLSEMLSDPLSAMAARWAAICPPFVARRA
jgi:hypothetical protein